ncbi:PREDICTED: POU domain, class 5, transcription factor 2 [Dipodomys ordii]|uniref:POU domain protein n=1 Tax=Dipodomys ordii TaxID=10020 RepID=A0A1S3FNF3_DIPOR|nr:PREDICTED: POU domain, class 5, transcription factor 2 [Dipodomys ordii]
MAGLRPSNVYPLPGSGGGVPGGAVPLRVDTPTWLSTPATPGRLVVRPGMGPGICRGPEVWGLPLGPTPYEFLGEIAPRGAAEAGAWFRSRPEGACLGPYIALRCIPKLAVPEDVSAIEKEMEQLAKELRQKRLTLGYSQADVGFAVGAMFGKVLSQTTICRFEAQQLSLANMWKLRPLLKMWLEEVDEKNLLGLCKMDMILQQGRKRRRASRERRIGINLEKLFLQCPKPTPQQISRIAGHLRLQKDLVQVWFYNRSQMGSWPTTDVSLRENVGAARPPLPGPPMCFPLAPGFHFDFHHYGGPCLTPLYSSTHFPAGGTLLSAPATTLGLPRLSS